MFTGSAVALITPFSDNRVDYKALARLFEFHCANRTDAIVVCGTTGESATLTHEEHEELISFSARELPSPRGKEGAPWLIAGTGSNSTAEAVRLTAHAAEVGVDAALVITPYYNKPTQSGLIRHFETVAQAVDLPLIPYCVPGRTAVNIAVDTAVALSQLPGVVGLKEASGDLEQISEIIRRSGDGFSVWSGDDSMTWPIIAMGGKGVISVTANVAPRRMHDFVAACLAGNVETARRMHHDLFSLHKVMFVETSPIPVKTAVQLMHEAGVPGVPPAGNLRPPLYEISDAGREKLVRVLKERGVLP